VKRGRTFVSAGPILLLEVDGHEPGAEIDLAAGAPSGLRVTAEALSIARIDSLQIIVNGEVAQTIAASEDSLRISFDGEIDMPEGGWIAARVLGPASDYFGDDYAFAHTSPVYVVRGGRHYVDREDVAFLSATVDEIWARVEDGRWRSDEEKARFRASVDSAKAVYSRRSAGLANN
jgi:hypothetical protein